MTRHKPPPPPPAGHGDYAWGCRVRRDPRGQGYDFTYVYGALADYQAFRARDSDAAGHTLHKGWGTSLEQVRDWAEAAAARLRPVYEDLGSVTVVGARD